MVVSSTTRGTAISNDSLGNASVVIIGAGISGICQAIDLIQRAKCKDIIILESGAGVGGVWRENKYPGCTCDVRSALYSFSFEQNPSWSRIYPGQEEILSYLVGVATKYDLFRYIRFNSAVESARWDEGRGKWVTSVKVFENSRDEAFTPRGRQYDVESDFLISAVGQLQMPKWPDIDGLAGFRGKVMHSAKWDWSYDLKGKRVALIGNAATAVQIVPEIVEEVAHLTIYQRTPNWIIPRGDGPTTTLTRVAKQMCPPLMWRERAKLMDYHEGMHPAFVSQDNDLASFCKMLNAGMLQEAFPNDEEMRDRLTPKYSIGCKRMLVSDDYYPCLARDNVSLEMRNIKHITESGIAVSGGGSEEHEEFDLIICATGFRVSEFMYPIQISGRNGKNIADIWEKGAHAFKGVSVPDLPNFAMLYGVNTNLGHNSIILMIEAQSRHIAVLARAVLDARAEGKHVAITPRREKVDAYNKALQAKLENSTFGDPACKSWYRDARTGVLTANWSGNVVEYQKLLETVDWEDYEGADKIVGAGMGNHAVHVSQTREATVYSDLWLASAAFLVAAAGSAAWIGRHGGLKRFAIRS